MSWWCSNRPAYHIKTRHDDLGQQNLPCFVVKLVIRTSWPCQYLVIELQVVSNNQKSSKIVPIHLVVQRSSTKLHIQTKTIQTIGVQALSLPAGYKRWRSPPNLDSNCFTKSSKKKWQPNSVLIVWGCFGSFLGEISHNSTPIFVWLIPFQVHGMKVRCELKSGRSPSL